MSYVIQNFYNLNKLLVITPRFKLLLLLLNNDKLFLFYKINMFLKFLNVNQIIDVQFYHLFFKYLYILNISSQLFKLNKTSTNYLNNFHLSLTYYNIFNLNNLLDNNFKKNSIMKINETFLFNFYFFSIKLINFKINKKFYENFLFFLIFDLYLWNNKTYFFKFYLNFIIIHWHLQFYNFYNGLFLNIYNY